MANNYAKGLPIDRNMSTMQQFPAPYPALKQYNSANAVASSVISLTKDTSEIEVGSFGGQGVCIKWIPLTDVTQASVVSSGAGANFDHFIPAGWYRQFVVPKETQGLGTAPMGVGSMFGLYQRVAIINAGITASSVLLSEY